ncbi:unnamed protein product [Toxocara canis]|uniref:Secreted protein n=1 Tax=Toxocara canis TaxID=6265 RepID=A0A183UD78_TOXCA|nr:unnamed protein product [Toxocara canis]
MGGWRLHGCCCCWFGCGALAHLPLLDRRLGSAVAVSRSLEAVMARGAARRDACSECEVKPPCVDRTTSDCFFRERRNKRAQNAAVRSAVTKVNDDGDGA